MRNNIVDYATEQDYLDYLNGLDSHTLLREFSACDRLKRQVNLRLERLCQEVCNSYYSYLVDVDYDDITSFYAYLIRVLSRFEVFVSSQLQHINELRNYYDPRTIHSKSSESLTPTSVLEVYTEVMSNFHHLENIVSSFKKRTNMWLYFLYGRGDIPEELKTEEIKKSVCALNEDGSYDFKSQLKVIYKELVRIIETELNLDISKFKFDGEDIDE